MSNTVETLGEALPREIARNQNLLIAYAEIGPAGNFGASMIRADIVLAVKALAEGDLTQMISSYNALKDNQ